MKKILILGANGQVGWELQRTLAPLGTVIALDRNELDLVHSKKIPEKLEKIHPDIIVNAAAYTAVDKAESDKELAMEINAISPGILAEEAKRLNAILVHYSTDYVFDGKSSLSYQEDSSTNPLNIYGASKLEGERAIQKVAGRHLIFRTSWVYGTRGKNFLLTMLKLAKERDSLNIVQDQIGAPTWCRMIAEATGHILSQLQMSSKEPWGIYNLTSSGKTSWKDFAEAIFHQAHAHWNTFRVPKITGIPTEAYPTPAQRPKNSLLSHDKLQETFNLTLPSWEKSLKLCMEELNVFKSMRD
jgi:dTDP-4-dehydrorhamnose reductase